MRDARLLRKLPELPFLHLTVPAIPAELVLGAQSERLVEVTRITGALSISCLPVGLNGISLADPPNSELDKAAAIVQAANQRRVGPPCTLTACYTPYHQQGAFPNPNDYPLVGCLSAEPWPCGCVEYPGCTDDPRQTCGDTDEITTYTQRMTEIRDALPIDVVIGQQFFDCERWSWKLGDLCGTWNAAVTAKHDLFFLAGKDVLPAVPIFRYERGSVACTGTGAPAYFRVPGNFYTLNEVIDTGADLFSVSAFTVPDLKRTRATLAETIADAVDKGDVTSVVPWLGLASGFRELGTRLAYDADWNYGVRAIRDVAKLIRRDTSGLLNVVGLYPEPFSRSTPRWLRYFIEYTRATVG